MPAGMPQTPSEVLAHLHELRQFVESPMYERVPVSVALAITSWLQFLEKYLAARGRHG